MRYRRAREKGGTYFFTVVTFQRERVLTQPENATLLCEAFKHVMARHPFEIDALAMSGGLYPPKQGKSFTTLKIQA